MTRPGVSDEDLVRIWDEEGGSPARVAARIGVSVRNVHYRRVRLERQGHMLDAADPQMARRFRCAYPRRAFLEIEDGVALAFGDGHCLPVEWREDGDTPAMAAALRLAEDLQPTHLLCMGDMLDGASISRHPPLGWEVKPRVEDELGAVQHDLSRLRRAAPNAKPVWIVGNHDERYDRTLAQRVPDFRDVLGTSLSDSFPDWAMSWSLEINGALVAVHRWHAGVHAAWNNVMKSGGAHLITGDTHRLTLRAYTGQIGQIYAVECGTLADPRGRQFEYTRGLDPNWQAGFAVLTWRGGVLMPPELCQVDNAGVAWFRGRAIAGKPRVRVKARAA
jgi:hypothetical protein